MTSDLDLLRQFTRENSQDAFSEIVRRHLDLVYSAALRQVRSPQLAEDVAQSVFADLARDARKLKPGTILTAWLYTVARRTAVDTLRKEVRRQVREQIAVEMNDMNATADDWAQIAPLLDDAMAALDETDRVAILLRYFENKSLREVGESLAISDDAAQKRVSRALESLREFFPKQRLTIAAGGLAVLISVNAVKAAPMGLAATISTALAGTIVQSSSLIGTTKTIAVTTLQKGLVVAGLAAVAATGVYTTHKKTGLREEIQSLQQQQSPLATQLQELQGEYDDATNQLAALLAQSAQAGSNDTEISRLRREVAQLEAREAQRKNDPIVSAAADWLGRVKMLKDYLTQHPEEKIPELKYLSDKDWTAAADSGNEFTSTNELENAIQSLKFAAVSGVSESVENALMEYSQANNQKFPDNLSELQPYLDPDMANTLEQLYEIAPASIVHDTTSKIYNGVTIRAELPPNIPGQRVITRKTRPNPTSTTRIALFTGGFAYWQSPLGSDNSQ
ncbi:MAG TPA: sigma-70 family RNA polymerase sigma factor [Candidatus Acidoferrum sp.]|jgi:RNA polymerase sigma factor (sigma-70 family)|nr:sigma-70 family RNA polymerase sigma factor [Candidatus Acidoferrum sp.]